MQYQQPAAFSRGGRSNTRQHNLSSEKDKVNNINIASTFNATTTKSRTLKEMEEASRFK